VLEQAIAELQKIEQSVERKTLSNLKIRMALRSCLKELRGLSLAAPPMQSGLAGLTGDERFCDWPNDSK
jgi:hypothetical protein